LEVLVVEDKMSELVWREEPIYAKTSSYFPTRIIQIEKGPTFMETFGLTLRLLVLSGFISTVLCCTYSCGHAYHKYLARVNDLEYVMPDSGAKKDYDIQGETATISKDDDYFWDSTLRYKNIEFLTGWGYRGKVKEIRIYNENGYYESLSRNDMKDYDDWEYKYESLIQKMKESKENLEIKNLESI
jgi:hypothetical protein